MTVLYTFTAATDAWTGQKTENYPIQPWGDGVDWGESSITDTWDFYSARYQPYDPWHYPVGSGNSSYLAFTWKQVSNPATGVLHRMKFKFSFTALPPQNWYSILALRYGETGDPDPGQYQWISRTSLQVLANGSLREYYFGISTPSGTISAGVLYDVEWIILLNPNTQKRSEFIYLNSVLVMSGGEGITWSIIPPTYSEIVAGIEWGESIVHQTTLHMEDIVWTIESIESGGRWTMMALL